jgi:hypothetical protein
MIHYHGVQKQLQLLTTALCLFKININEINL